MASIDYIGFDIHKKTISFCAKAQDGTILDEGTIAARRNTLLAWAKARARPWIGAMEATLFTGWIYDFLKPLAQELKVAHPAMLKAITASKKKNDKVDARTVADLLRCNLLPECYMAPSAIRDLRRVLRYRNLVVRQATRMKNRIAGLLMETGTPYNKERLHGKAYFSELLGSLREVPRSVVELLQPEPGTVGVLRYDPAAAAEGAVRASGPQRARGAITDHPRGGRDHGPELGSGSRRGEPASFDCPGGQLLRADQRAAQFGRQRTTRADFQAA